MASFDVVLEESSNADREYRYSMVVSHEISSMAEPFDDKRTLARRGWKSKCVHPPPRPSEGDEFDQLMGFEADADQLPNPCVKATGHSYSTDLVCSSLALPVESNFLILCTLTRQKRSFHGRFGKPALGTITAVLFFM